MSSFQACRFPDYVPGATGDEACIESSCDACELGSADCNGDPSDGCEISLGTRVNCGQCGQACDNDNGLNECVTVSGAGSWVCQPTCAPGYDDCDLHPDNGCETNIHEDALNCGGCGQACPGNGGTPNCIAGVCGVSACNDGFGDCKNSGRCDFELFSDPQNCGQCGHVCSAEHGEPRCNAGQCAIDCEAGYGDCNGADGVYDGCETKLNVPDAGGDVPNCGACGSLCKRRAYTKVNLDHCAQGECFRDCWDGAFDCDHQRNDPGCSGSGCGCEFTACK